MAGPDMQKIEVVRKYKDIKQKQGLLSGCNICDSDDSMYIVLCTGTPLGYFMARNKDLFPYENPHYGVTYVYMKRDVVDYIIDHLFKHIEECRQYVEDNRIDLTSIP